MVRRDDRGHRHRHDVDGIGARMAWVALRGLGLVLVVWLLAHRVLPPLLDRLARAPELVVLFGLAWAVAIGAVTQTLGLSMEVGAFLAGLSLASTSYREAIGARLVSLRDVLVLFFFIDLGSGLELGEIGAQVLPALALSAFVLVVKPLLVAGLMASMGYRKRVSARTGILTGQISEFSLLLVALGLGLGSPGRGRRGPGHPRRPGDDRDLDVPDRLVGVVGRAPRPAGRPPRTPAAPPRDVRARRGLRRGGDRRRPVRQRGGGPAGRTAGAGGGPQPRGAALVARARRGHRVRGRRGARAGRRAPPGGLDHRGVHRAGPRGQPHARRHPAPRRLPRSAGRHRAERARGEGALRRRRGGAATVPGRRRLQPAPAFEP